MEETRQIQEASVSGGSLEGVKQGLRHWRAQRKLGEHIPAPLWTAAVDATKEHGLHRVAIELRLDYAGLKRRVEQAGGTMQGSQVTPRFVELFATAAPAASAAAGRHECVVELENVRGAKMRVELNGGGLAGLAGLCAAFWGA